MINVLINGCNGRMGKEVAKVVQEQEDMTVIAGFDRTESDNGYFTVFADFAKLPVDKIDVIIDFSVPEATFAMLSFAKKHHIPMVIATTGFSQEERTQIQKEAKELPIFQSANMSFDINLMGKIVAELAKNLPDTDVEIIEAHHNQKIDAPSGTAILLADKINAELPEKCDYVFDRHANRSKRGEHEIGFSSIRGGNIVGTHTVQFIGGNETFEVTHTSYSRTVFAEGAVKAARFLTNMPNGFYDMNDLLKH